MEIQKKEKQTQKESNKKFMEKEKGKIYECKICNKKYSYYSKSKHNKSQYHKLAEIIIEKCKQP